jgi:hypothetical protein
MRRLLARRASKRLPALLYLFVVLAGAGIVAATVDALEHRAMPKAYGPPIAAALVVGIILATPSPRRLLLAIAAGAVVAALAAVGWGYSLSADDAARMLSRRHPELPRPVQCHRDPNAQRFFGTMYVCKWPGGRDGLEVRVNDTRIVREYP